MGSTVLCGKRVCAFRTTAGTVMYLLFESTYEQNCYPHEPSVSCVAFGPIARVMDWIIRSASSAAGGMLRSRRGAIDPLTHLRSYRRALAAPEWLEDFKVTLHASTEWRASVPYTPGEEGGMRCMDLAVGALVQHGRDDLAGLLASGQKLELEAYRDGDLLADIYDDCGGGGRIAPWRVFSPPSFTRGPDKALAPQKVKPDPSALPDMQLYRLDEPTERTRMYHHSVNLLLVDGFASRFGYAAHEGSFIGTVVAKLEADHPGQAEIAIARFRDLGNFEDAPMAPANMAFLVDRSKVATQWQKECYEKLGVLLNGRFAESADRMVLSVQDIRIAESSVPDDNPVHRLLGYLGEAVTVMLGEVSVSVPALQTDMFAVAA